MNTLRLLQFFLPSRNPLGFGISDFIELGFTLLAVLFLVTRTRASTWFVRLARHKIWSLVVLAALPVVLRLLLLPHHPVPVPAVSDDFSYLLLGDTLAHFRLASPPHPMSRFFETVFVLQSPSYSSIYPLGPGFVLALGQLLFRLPWAGVLLSVGLFCALTCWMLRAWVSPAWAAAGGVLAVLQFGPLNQWTNNYWGGDVSAIAGCLAFGAVPRLWRQPCARDAALLGTGMALQVLTRPWEAVLLLVCLLPVLPGIFRGRSRLAAWAMIAFSPALVLTLAHNKAVTGSVSTLPYMLSRYQYGIPATFTFQANAVPHRPLNQEQAMDYQAQQEVHGSGPETVSSFARRLAGRVRFLRFFFLPPLYLALAFSLPLLRRPGFAWAAACLLVFALGVNIYPYFYPHYVAAVACLCLLFSVAGLERLHRTQIRGFPVGRDAARLLGLLCLAHFTFWYGVHLVGGDQLFIATGPYESWDYINFGDFEGRAAIERVLLASPGQQLVFVRFSPRHTLREWVYNEADIDSSRVVRALDRGPEEDALLRQYYPHRTAWLLEPDTVPPRLGPYSVALPKPGLYPAR